MEEENNIPEESYGSEGEISNLGKNAATNVNNGIQNSVNNFNKLRNNNGIKSTNKSLGNSPDGTTNLNNGGQTPTQGQMPTTNSKDDENQNSLKKKEKPLGDNDSNGLKSKEKNNEKGSIDGKKNTNKKSSSSGTTSLEKKEKDDNLLKKIFGLGNKSGKASDKATISIKIKMWLTIGIIAIVAALALFLIIFLTTTAIPAIFNGIKYPGFLCEISNPLPEGDVSSIYSWRNLNGVANAHKGIDLTASKGTEVKAAATGKVVEVNYDETGYGYYIIIDHEEYENYNYKTVYAHMCQPTYGKKSTESDKKNVNKADVDEDEQEVYYYPKSCFSGNKPSTTINVLEVGDEVTEGQVIGYVNSTGTSTGNHLHFEIRKNGNQISPNRFFGYQDVTGSCNPHVEDVTLDKIQELKCDEKIIEEDDFRTYCKIENVCGGSSVGGELPKLVDSSSKYECAAGVYNYFVRYLKNDQETFSKFSQISGDARDYWNKNESLSLFSTSTQPIPGSIYYTNFSNSKDSAGNSYGHVFVVIGVDGDNVEVFECNYDHNKSCHYITYSASSLAGKTGFKGYINILGCGSGEISGGAGCSGEPITNYNFTVDDNNKLPADYVPCLTTVGGVQVEATAAKELEKMIEAAATAGVTLTPASGYRTYEWQKNSKERKCPPAVSNIALDCLQTANPGASEHQTGLAIDFAGVNTTSGLLCNSGSSIADGKIKEGTITCGSIDKVTYDWLQKNSKAYGFYMSYPQGTTSTYGPEPWHYRYRGK